jgi:predicted branched-subunit amino acid permease
MIFTWQAFRAGMRATLPLLPAVFVFASVFGALAFSKGLSELQTLGMSFFVYAGLSQMMGLQVWQEVWTFSTLLAVVIVVFSVNLRMVLMSAALYPYLSQLKPHQSYLALFTLTDANFILTIKYEAEGKHDTGFFIGSGVLLWIVWIVMTMPGYYLAPYMGDIRKVGLDLFLPLFFGAMSISVFKPRRDRLVWVFTVIVALLAAHFIDGYWFIVIGGLSGAIFGGLTRDYQ